MIAKTDIRKKLHNYTPVQIKPKVYLILGCISIILFFINAWEIKTVVLDITDFLGLVSHLTIAYWLGFVIITVCSILIYSDQRLKNEWIFLFILLVVGLFLFGLGVFAGENSRFIFSYFPSGEVKNVLENHYVDITSTHPLMSYRSWPSLHFISAFNIYITGLELSAFIKYIPLFWVICFIFIVFIIGKQFNLSSNQCFLLTFVSLSSFWLSQYYYGGQSIAYILYLLIFMLIIPTTKIIHLEKKMMMTLTFIAMVISHVLTPFIAILSIIIQSIYMRSRYAKLLLFFIVIYIVWYVYLARMMFSVGLDNFINQAKDLDFFGFFLTTTKYSYTQLYPTRELVNHARLSYLGIYIIFMIGVTLLYITGRIREKKTQIGICFCWILGNILILLLQYGSEIEERAYLFSLIPMVIIIIFAFSYNKILVLLMILVIGLHIPAHYGDEAMQTVTTKELVGAKFFALKLDSYNLTSNTYYYQFPNLIWYQNPDSIITLYSDFSVDKSQPNKTVLYNVEYIINSKQTSNLMIYLFGFDYMQIWMQEMKNDLLYDNGGFWVYKRRS